MAGTIKQKVFKNAAIIAALTLLSRVLGLVRDIFIAAALGTTYAADAFFIAFKLPNMFRDIIAEGAANSSIIPVLSKVRQDAPIEEYHRLALSIRSLLLVIGLSLAALGVVFAPLLVSVIAPGFAADSALYGLAVALTRLIFPLIVFITIFGGNMSVLHTQQMFVSTALAQPFFNVAMASVAWFSLWVGMNEPVYGIALGVLISGLFLVVPQLIDIRRMSMSIFPLRPVFHPAIRDIGKLLLPRMAGMVVYHINILVDTILCSLINIVGIGAVSAVYYANRLLQLPLALFSVSLSHALVPTLSVMHTQQDDDGFASVLKDSIVSIGFWVLPSAVFLFFNNRLIVSTVFSRGSFTEASTNLTSLVLLGYTFGLYFFSLIKVFVSAFHAIMDTKTPVITAAKALVVNALLSVLLMFKFKVFGIALASSIAGITNAALLANALNKRHRFIDGSTAMETLKILLAGLAAGAAEWYALNILLIKVVSSKVLLTAFACISFCLLFGAACALFRIDMFFRIWGKVIRRHVKG